MFKQKGYPSRNAVYICDLYYLIIYKPMFTFDSGNFQVDLCKAQ